MIPSRLISAGLFGIGGILFIRAIQSFVSPKPRLTFFASISNNIVTFNNKYRFTLRAIAPSAHSVGFVSLIFDNHVIDLNCLIDFDLSYAHDNYTIRFYNTDVAYQIINKLIHYIQNYRVANILLIRDKLRFICRSCTCSFTTALTCHHNSCSTQICWDMCNGCSCLCKKVLCQSCISSHRNICNYYSCLLLFQAWNYNNNNNILFLPKDIIVVISSHLLANP